MRAPGSAVRWTDDILAQLDEAFPRHTLALSPPAGGFDRIGNNFKNTWSLSLYDVINPPRVQSHPVYWCNNLDWKTKIYYSPSPTELSCPPPPYLSLAHLVWRKSTFETQKTKKCKSENLWLYFASDTCPAVDLNMESSLRVRSREEEHLSKVSQNLLLFCCCKSTVWFRQGCRTDGQKGRRYLFSWGPCQVVGHRILFIRPEIHWLKL